MSYYKKKFLSKQKMISVPIHPACPYTPRLTVHILTRRTQFGRGNNEYLISFRRTDGRTDGSSYKDAWTHLKTKAFHLQTLFFIPGLPRC